MANEKMINSRLQQKHDVEANWNIAGEKGFIPKAGEIIIYDVDENHDKPRIKIGNDLSNVNDLPFISEATTANSVLYVEHPDGLIGICNIGMTDNDCAGRSFLSECGGSLYGDVDMHQNTLKNLPDPVDAGDAVSKAYLEAKLVGSGGSGGGGVSSWNDLTDKPFYSEMVNGYLLEKTAMVATEEMNYQAVLPHSISVFEGEEYTVVYNGTEYNCVCTFFNDEENGMVAYMLGNMMALGGEDTGEPFLVLVFPPEIATTTGMPGGVVPLDGNTEFTLAILGMVEKVVPIPEKYLYPAMMLYVGANKYLYKTADTSNNENLLIASELEALVKSGRVIYLYFKEDDGYTFIVPTQIGISSVGGVITTRSADGGYATFAAPNTREI